MTRRDNEKLSYSRRFRWLEILFYAFVHEPGRLELSECGCNRKFGSHGKYIVLW